MEKSVFIKTNHDNVSPVLAAFSNSHVRRYQR